jgi:cytochrome c biogenesis protein CcmG, thiol:disulfide interchange protein DsbE
VRRLLSPTPIAVILALAALLGLLAYGVSSTARDLSIEEALASGKRPAAPKITLPTLDGAGQASLADYRGRVVVLNYWASWCEPCRAEAPLLERWHRKLEDQGGTVLGIDVLDVSSDAKDFVRRYGLTYPMLRDADGDTQRQLGIVAYPETILVDRAGRIAAIRRGPVDEAFMRRHVAPLIAGGGSR